jgi:hypothetical protein
VWRRENAHQQLPAAIGGRAPRGLKELEHCRFTEHELAEGMGQRRVGITLRKPDGIDEVVDRVEHLVDRRERGIAAGDPVHVAEP